MLGSPIKLFRTVFQSYFYLQFMPNITSRFIIILSCFLFGGPFTYVIFVLWFYVLFLICKLQFRLHPHYPFRENSPGKAIILFVEQY